MIYFNDEKIVIKSWCNNPEEGAVEQAKHLANLPFAFHHIALMPDTHQGYGMPIGGVMATEGVVVPNAVGVDIGCGMRVVNTGLSEISPDNLKKIMGEIRKRIPMGMNRHKEPQEAEDMPKGNFGFYYDIVDNEWQNALCSLGTLGGGNHFIEIQKNERNEVCVMIHSGSRNLGKQVADHYNKIAIELNEKFFSSVPKQWQLAFLPLESHEGQCYLNEMNYCVDFARANRRKMMDVIEYIFLDVLGPVSFSPGLDVSHNYATMENHFGKNVMVHRKGATSAKLGEFGIIPGSQGTNSYIVEGVGNPDSFMSCSHGAGRKMGRKEAERRLNLEEEVKKLNDKGIIHGIRNINDLDEASGAYKDIDIVMEEQKDLVNIINKLEPIAVIKA